MLIRNLRLRNWKNFRKVDVDLTPRTFLVGPNASGKSNLLDALRFLRDVAEEGGGFQSAIRRRQGVSKIRSLHARARPAVAIGVEFRIDDTNWDYEIEFDQDQQSRARVRSEVVTCNSRCLLKRPDDLDVSDPSRLSQTHLEQINANREFRVLATALAGIKYLHLVPQLIREPDRSTGRIGDPFGGDFLAQLATFGRSNPKAFAGRMRRLNEALKVAVPQLQDLGLARDEKGIPHLEAVFQHWRPGAGRQTEDQFSDGSLRLIGLLWSVLDGDAPLLLEEPELSLHPSLVRILPLVLGKVAAGKDRQIVVSTHSTDLLSDPGIAARDVLLLEPSKEGTEVRSAARKKEIVALVEAGWPVGEAVLPSVAPRGVEQLLLQFGG